MEFLALNNGVKMPKIGFGVFQIPDAAQAEAVVNDALETGYKMIDTAASYLNEAAVGAAIQNSGIKREELFITTKLWVQDYGYENTLKAFDVSKKKLKLDYLFINPTAIITAPGGRWNACIKRDAFGPSA